MFLPTHSESLLTQAYQNQVNEMAAQWANTHQPLDPFSLQLMGNFLYFSYKQTILDEEIFRRSATFMRILKKTMHLVKEDENPKGATSLLAYTIHQFRTTIDARYDLYMSWKHCKAYLEEHGNETVHAALEKIQQHGQQLIATYAYDHRKNIDQSMAHMQSTLEAEQTDMATSLKTIRELLEGTDPVYNNAELVIFDFALKLSEQVEQNSWGMLNQIQSLHMCQREILSLSKELFFAYYKEVYKQLEQGDEQYQMILFSPRGFLTKSDQISRLQP
jgi:hypothetical protein